MDNLRNLPASLGGEGWSPREQEHVQEIGSVWAKCGISDEWSPLREVLLHLPGSELSASDNPNEVQMDDFVDVVRAQAQHQMLAQTYRNAGVKVSYLQPRNTPPPNLMFVADLFFMTPEGAIVGRPASTVRAGEERYVAETLANLGVPILQTVRGRGTFECADGAWLNERTVLLGEGLRSNRDGLMQVQALLSNMGVKVIFTELPVGTMHLMGQLRFLGPELAMVWKSRVHESTLAALREAGYEVLDVPSEEEAIEGMALNFVTVCSKSLIFPAGNPRTEDFLGKIGVELHCVDIDEIGKAAGGIGCLSGVLWREC